MNVNIEEFIINATNHGNAIEEGNHRKANKLNKKLTEMYSNLNHEEKLLYLNKLIQNPNISVKLWAAIFLLKHDSERAIKVLLELSKDSSIHSIDAKVAIDLWNKSKLNN